MPIEHKSNQPDVAERMAEIEPFYVMAILARARELESAGKSIIHMEIGEPDFVTPDPIVKAGIRALSEGYTHYTPAAGLMALRKVIATHYVDNYGINISPERVVVTPGASGALQLVLGILINPGDEVLMADPGYPCNRHFVRLVEGQAVNIPVDASTSYQLTPDLVDQHRSAKTRAVMLASPSNPTGTLVSRSDLDGIVKICSGNNIQLIIDEIYHGLVYDEDAISALSISDNVFIINSFSKYYGMTGWRVGWLVAPESYVPEIDKLAQNIFLAAPTMAQHAALAAFSHETQAILEDRRDEFKRRRDFLLPALRELGFTVPVVPQGAFYLYAGCERFTEDSYDFAVRLLEEAGVAITPGRDFGKYENKKHVRFAYTTSLKNLEEGIRRIGDFL